MFLFYIYIKSKKSYCSSQDTVVRQSRSRTRMFQFVQFLIDTFSPQQNMSSNAPKWNNYSLFVTACTILFGPMKHYITP